MTGTRPEFSGLVKIRTPDRPADDELATAQTIARMVSLTRADSLAPELRQAALEATRGAADVAAKCGALFWWIKRRVRFLEDRTLIGAYTDDSTIDELLIRPLELLRDPDPEGDCDDFSMLTAAMLRSLGIETYFKTIAADPDDPAVYSHVYAVAVLPSGERLAMDTSNGPYPGWEARPAGKSRLWRIDVQNGLGEIDWGSLIKTGADTFSSIAKNRWGQPPAGTYMQQGENILFRQPAGATSFTFPGTQIGFGGTSSLILIVGAVAVMLLLTSRNR
jgi:hypothetical protein